MTTSMKKHRVYVHTLPNDGFNGILEMETDAYIEITSSNPEPRLNGKRLRIYTRHIHFIRFDGLVEDGDN